MRTVARIMYDAALEKDKKPVLIVEEPKPDQTVSSFELKFRNLKNELVEDKEFVETYAARVRLKYPNFNISQSGSKVSISEEKPKTKPDPEPEKGKKKSHNPEPSEEV